jgi:hypothetical protein
MQFPPAGEPVTGTIDYSSENIYHGVHYPGIVTVAITGNFAGGDGGIASGDYVGTEQITCTYPYPDNDSIRQHTKRNFPFYFYKPVLRIRAAF